MLVTVLVSDSPGEKDEKRHTVSALSPNTDALERIVLSMKLKLYVMNMIGKSLQSIFRNTFRARSASIETLDSTSADLDLIEGASAMKTERGRRPTERSL